MAIKVQCGSCGAAFKAKDEYAGRSVKCPKCKQPLKIPARRAAPASKATAAATTAARHNPLLDLLDEAGVEAAPTGPMCQNCGSDMQPEAIICMECGFNNATGERIETTVYDDPDAEYADGGLTDAEKILRKAEREIDDMPVTSVGQDFGDGADSFLVAFIGLVMMGVLVAIGVGVIYLMDLLGDKIDSAKISFYASIGIYVLCAGWITIVAFLMKPLHGIGCVLTGGLYAIIFGFLQGKALILPTIILCASIVIGLISYVFAFTFKEDAVQLWVPAQELMAQLI